MRERLKHFFLISAILLIVGTSLYVATDIYASNGTVTFGSNSYQMAEGEVFNVGVYVGSDSVVTNYHVELYYDSSKIRYISGADAVDTENGIMYFEGTSNQTNFRFWLTCEAIEPGNTDIHIANTVLHTVNESGETVVIEMASEASAPMTILEQVKEETVVELKEELAIENEETGIDAEKEETEETVEETEYTETNDEEGDTGETLENLVESETSVEQNTEALLSTETCEVISASDTLSEKLSFLGIRGIQLYFILAIFFTGVIFSVVGIALLIIDMKREKKARIETIKRKQELENSLKAETEKEEIEYLDVSLEKPETREHKKTLVRAVIMVENVSMKFNIATSNANGIKDYIIQKIKKQVTTKEFYALKDISFNVFKGEVVGIIGTNGSGKSTLLKIISGAMTPTDGRVLVDRRKIQILTLGTGFDMELTARENVYLNGSIIGYTKEFIDAHYQEIVDFAELEDFMEEKVKNFSSGMVSRLGFAIATVADAAEILILDEVLAVGDEFFRKKSLARIKELIHGGSTVLLVSHSMPTIVENCTKVVWIEKGNLRMVGNPDEVCAEYRKLKENV